MSEFPNPAFDPWEITNSTVRIQPVSSLIPIASYRTNSYPSGHSEPEPQRPTLELLWFLRTLLHAQNRIRRFRADPVLRRRGPWQANPSGKVPRKNCALSLLPQANAAPKSAAPGRPHARPRSRPLVGAQGSLSASSLCRPSVVAEAACAQPFRQVGASSVSPLAPNPAGRRAHPAANGRPRFAEQDAHCDAAPLAWHFRVPGAPKRKIRG